MKQQKKLILKKRTVIELNLSRASRLMGGTSDIPPQDPPSTGKICNTSITVPNTMRGLPITSFKQ